MGAIRENLGRLLGKMAGVITSTDIEDLVRHDRFSEYLPYRVYNPENGMYRNSDSTVGFIWECSPIYFASDTIADNMSGLFKIGFPDGTVMQFILHADPDIDPIVKSFLDHNTIKENPVINSVNEEFAKFLISGKDGVAKLSSVPLRNFRLFVALKYPDVKGLGFTEAIGQQISAVENILRGCYLHPQRLNAEDLINWLFRLYNDKVVLNKITYDETKGINEQIIKAETVIQNHKNRLDIGNKKFKCLSIKTAPKYVDTIKTRELIGGIWGLASDGAQITSPFLYAVNVIFVPLKAEISTKAFLTTRQMRQKKEKGDARTIAIARRQEEFNTAVDQIEQGVRFVRVIPLMWIYDTNEQKLENAVTNTAEVVWGQQGYEMQRDWGLLPALFLCANPFGLYNSGNNIKMINRHFDIPGDTCVRILPYQAGYRGSGRPMTVLADRNAQLCSQDIWAPRAPSHNGLICATTGKGKSFWMNFQIMRYVSNCAQVFIVDIGRSYEKLAKIVNGRYLRFTKDANICINPFSIMGKGSDEVQYDIASIANILMNMVYSATSPSIDETEVTTMKRAVQWAYEKEGNEAKIDTIREFLWQFPRYDREIKDMETKQSVVNITEQAHKMAYNLDSFCSNGIYGKWFNGATSFDISKEQMAVLEMEELKAVPELFKVITLQVMDYVTKVLYLGDRQQQKLIKFDEAHLFLKNASIMGDIIEQIYRRARKYNAGIWIITQSVLDLPEFAGGIGRVMWSNSAFRYLLESADFVKAKQDGFLSYDNFVMNLLTTVKTDQGRYSEIFIDGPDGIGIGRFVVPEYLYYVFTTKAEEVAEIDSLVAKYKADMPVVSEQELYDRVIKEIVRRRNDKR